MKLNRRSMVVVLSLVALVLIGGSAYLLRDRFFASDLSTAGEKSFTIKVVAGDNNNAPIENAEVAVVWAPARDLSKAPLTKTYLFDPVKDLPQTQQFITGAMSGTAKADIKTNSEQALLNSSYNNQMLDPFDESQSLEDYGLAWYNHHISTSTCSFEPCFKNSLALVRFTNKEDKGTDVDGNLVFKMKYLGNLQNTVTNDGWYVARIYVRYNGQTTVKNLFIGGTIQDILTKVNDGGYIETVTLPVTAPVAVSGEAGVSVLVKSLQEQPIQGATVEFTMQCYKNGVESYNSTTANEGTPYSVKTDGSGIAKFVGAAWETNIVSKLGFNQDLCPHNKQNDVDIIGGVTYTKSLTVNAYYVDKNTKGFNQHGPFAFMYNGAYADQFYINTDKGAGFTEPTTGNASAAVNIQSFYTDQNPIDFGAVPTYRWASTGATTCAVSPAPTATPDIWSNLPATGSVTPPAETSKRTNDIVKTLVCKNAAGESATATLIVYTKPGFVTAVANNRTDKLAYGDHATLTWKTGHTDVLSANNPETCKVNPGNITLPSGATTWTSNALKAPTTFTVSCSSIGGTAESSVLVDVSTDVASTAEKCLVDATTPLVGGKTPIPATCENKSVIIDGGTAGLTVYSDLVGGQNTDPNNTQRHFDNVTIKNGAVVTHRSVSEVPAAEFSYAKLYWTLTGSLTLESNGKINVDGKGYAGGTVTGGCPVNGGIATDGAGPAGGGGKAATVNNGDYAFAGSGANAGNGGSYIGNGLQFLGGTGYIDRMNPTQGFSPGAGGGGTYARRALANTYISCFNGGAGGGRILIDSLQGINIAAGSTITANGLSSVKTADAGSNPNDADHKVSAGGAGAGGYIYLIAKAYKFPTNSSSDASVLGGSAPGLNTQGTYGYKFGSFDNSIMAVGGNAYANQQYSTSGGGGMIYVATR